MARLGPDRLDVVVVAAPVSVFRVVNRERDGSTPTLGSFRSSYELGRPPRVASPEDRFRIVHMGISCFDSQVAAARVGAKWGLGTHVATLRLEPEQGFSLARWGSRGHMTVWGEPLKFLDAVVDTVGIDEVLR